MDKIEFTTQEKDLMAQKVKVYFRDELNQDIGSFDAETLFTEKVSEISDLLLEMEKPIE